MPVVSVQPDRQRSGTVVRGGVGLSVGPFAQGGLDKALGLAVCLGRIGLGPDVCETEIAAGGAEGLGAIAGAIVSHHTGNRDAEVRVVGDCGLEEGDRALLFSSGRICEKATREASSMQTWTNSHPTPRRLLCPVRSPVMRWPTRSKRPSFLISMWISSPGCSRS